MNYLRMVLVDGTLRVIRQWRLVLPLWLTSVVIGLIGIWPLYIAFGNGLTSRPFARVLAERPFTGMVDGLIGIDSTTLSFGGAFLVLSTLFLLIVTGLAYNFFSGGILSRYANGLEFWPGCRRFFWRFVALGLFGVSLLVVVLFLTTYLGGFAGLNGTALLVVLAIISQMLNTILELARALVVAQNANPILAIGRAINLLVKKPVAGLAVIVAGAVVLGLVTVIYNAVVGSLSSLSLVVLLVLWQQVAVLGQQMTKLLRLSWALALAEATSVPPPGVMLYDQTKLHGPNAV